MRLFISIELPEAQRRQIQRVAGPLREADLPVRWVRPEAYHLTLRFLGSVSPARVPEVEAAMTEVAEAASPFSIELLGLGGAPTLVRPRVLWIEIAESEPLRELHGALEGALAGCGFEPEERAFRPHLTLGRARRDAPRWAFADLASLAEGLDFAAGIPVRALTLMRSQLSSQGAHYEAVSVAELGKGG